MKLRLGASAYNRSYAGEAEIINRNRFFEADPTDDDQAALVSRPGTTLETSVGAGPGQNLYTLKGLFVGALFIATGGQVYYRTVSPKTNNLIAGAIDPNSTPRMAGVIGAGYQRMFIADGTSLQYYGGKQYKSILTLTPGGIHDDNVTIDGKVYVFSNLLDAAQAVLTTTGTIADDKVNIGANTYQFATTPSGSHAGTVGDPWQVKVNGSNTNALGNLLKAINLTGVAGTDYDNGVTLNANVTADYSTATAMGMHAKVAGAAGNSITTTITVVGGTDNLAWTGPTMLNGNIAGSAAGTLAAPWHVFLAGSDANALANLRKAVNASGVAGTDYSTGVIQNLRAEANANTALTVTVRGRQAGLPQPSIIVSVTTFGASDGLAWSINPLAVDVDTLFGVVTPLGDDNLTNIGISDVVCLNSYILCLKPNSQRIYYIRPGTTVINSLDFFEAESEPDNINGLVVVGDQVLLVGQGTVEPWYLDGTDPLNPFQRVQGAPISHGGLTGTFVEIANQLILVGDDKMVYSFQGGPSVISSAGIAERVRKWIEAGGG